MLAKLSEALFVETLRRYIAGPEQEVGWLAGTRDPIAGKCLGLFHGRSLIRGRLPRSQTSLVFRGRRSSSVLLAISQCLP